MINDRTMSDAHVWTTVRFARIEISRLQEEQQQMLDRLVLKPMYGARELSYVINHRARVARRIDSLFDLIAHAYEDDMGNW